MEAYGLVGHPLGHSFSAGYFAEKFARDVAVQNFESGPPTPTIFLLLSVICHIFATQSACYKPQR